MKQDKAITVNKAELTQVFENWVSDYEKNPQAYTRDSYADDCAEHLINEVEELQSEKLKIED